MAWDQQRRDAIENAIFQIRDKLNLSVQGSPEQDGMFQLLSHALGLLDIHDLFGNNAELNAAMLRLKNRILARASEITTILENV